MTELLYCGTPPVSWQATQEMLCGEFGAVWAPPMYRRAYPKAGDRLWLLWRSAKGATPLLLGVGFVTATPAGKIDWTNRTAPGVVAAARERGFSGPTNMAFLRLADVRCHPPDSPAVRGLGDCAGGLSVAHEKQVLLLSDALGARRNTE